MKFNEKLQLLRKDRGLSQENFAELLNVSRQAVSKWENGTAYPEIEKLLFISKYFSISLDDLFNENLNEIKNQKISNKYSIVKLFLDYFSNLSVTQKLLLKIIATILIIASLFNLGYGVGYRIGEFIYHIKH